ncbi:hypothetical protein, partial [Streptomyces sp. NPDC047968]|uniref:hypothetical protein n=1 Tax=Streptomyces sp. NPDC047968 TaxID=3155382 RepID=UPI0034312696
ASGHAAFGAANIVYQIHRGFAFIYHLVWDDAGSVSNALCPHPGATLVRRQAAAFEIGDQPEAGF